MADTTTAGHRAEPCIGTRMASPGVPGAIPGGYPEIGECTGCHGRIVKDAPDAAWRHSGHVHTFVDANWVQRAHVRPEDCDACRPAGAFLAELAPHAALRDAQPAPAPVGGLEDPAGMETVQARPSVPPGLTDEDGKVPCTACGAWHPPNKSGLCVTCWRASGGPRANAMAKHGQGEPRKFDPAEHGAFLARMLTAAGRRARTEDPGQGVAMLLEVQRRVDALVKEVGTDVLAQYQGEYEDGLSAMAADLTMGTGEPWSKQRVWKRWAAKQNGHADG